MKSAFMSSGVMVCNMTWRWLLLYVWQFAVLQINAASAHTECTLYLVPSETGQCRSLHFIMDWACVSDPCVSLQISVVSGPLQISCSVICAYVLVLSHYMCLTEDCTIILLLPCCVSPCVLRAAVASRHDSTSSCFGL